MGSLGDEIADASDTHDSAFCGHLADRFVGFAPRLVRIEAATIRMSDQDRRFGNFKCIKGSAVAAMRDVDRHSYFIHPIDDGNAEITDSIVAPLRASVADQVAGVIGQQRYALPELIETIDVVRGPKMLRVLQPQNNTDFA